MLLAELVDGELGGEVVELDEEGLALETRLGVQDELAVGELGLGGPGDWGEDGVAGWGRVRGYAAHILCIGISSIIGKKVGLIKTHE